MLENDQFLRIPRSAPPPPSDISSKLLLLQIHSVIYISTTVLIDRVSQHIFYTYLPYNQHHTYKQIYLQRASYI